MRVLMTGATGFIGSRLAAAHLRDGDEVHLVVRPTSDLRRLPSTLPKERLHFFDGSMTSLLEAVSVCRPDVVVHLASLFLAQHNQNQVQALIDSNISFGALMLEAMIANSVFAFINTSSVWLHYNNEDYNPANLYASTKKAFSDVLRYYTEATPLKAITLELPDTYGPNDPRRKIVSILVESIQKREHISLTAGEQFLDLVHVDDIVDAFRLAAQRVFSQGEKNSVYSLSSGRLMKLKHIVELLKGLSQDASLIEMGARSYRFREVMTAWNKGTSLPGWSPFRKIEDFLAEQLS